MAINYCIRDLYHCQFIPYFILPHVVMLKLVESKAYLGSWDPWQIKDHIAN